MPPGSGSFKNKLKNKPKNKLKTKLKNKLKIGRKPADSTNA
jgi:hypothetical protein